MKVLKLVQRHYAILGISSTQQHSTKFNLSFKQREALGLVVFLWNIFSQILYIFYVANDFMEYVNCISATCGSVIVFVSFTAVVVRKSTLFESFDMIEELLATRCKHRKSKLFYMKTDQQVERLCEIVFMVLLKIAVQIIMLPKSIASFVTYFFIDSGPDSFQLPVPLWFPFDSNNLIGYLIAVIFEYIIVGYEYLIAGCTLALGSGAFWYAISATKEIQCILHSINKKAKANKKQSNEKLMVLFSEYIHAHGIVKQVEHNFSNILQPIIMTLFTWSLFAISGAMIILQEDLMRHGNIMFILLPVINGIVALILVFIACELGERMNDAFEKIDVTIEQCDWYLLPIKIKRMLPMIHTIAQQPVSLECFGSIICSRDVFKNVIHRAYSYFMVLRQLGN